MTHLFTRSRSKSTKKNTHNSEGKTYKYNCPECSNGTDDKTEYTAHMDRHSNIRHFKCNVCDQAFFSQSQLTTHTKSSCVVPTTRMSATTTDFECSVCGETLKSEDRYREDFRHQHVENENPKPFFCELCISRMYTEKGFNRHSEKCDGFK